MLRRLMASSHVVAPACAGIGCGWLLLYDAHQQGLEPLVGQTAAMTDHASSSRIVLTPSRVQQLERDGFLVVDHFLSPKEVSAAAAAVQRLHENGRFQVTPNEREQQDKRQTNYYNNMASNIDIAMDQDQLDTPVRTDAVVFFDGLEEQADKDSNLQYADLHRVQCQLGELARTLASSEFRGFDEENEGHPDQKSHPYSSCWLGVPKKMQVSRYGPCPDQGGSYYRAHYDACLDGWVSMGVLGYLRSLYLRKRYLTVIVYLNDYTWRPEHGGCLRVTHRDGTYQDVEPLAGRLVVFSSVHREHAVLPAHHERFACSMWLTLNNAAGNLCNKRG
jgi:2OG-Fe(II) oxygenase superfamily